MTLPFGSAHPWGRGGGQGPRNCPTGTPSISFVTTDWLLIETRTGSQGRVPPGAPAPNPQIFPSGPGAAPELEHYLG